MLNKEPREPFSFPCMDDSPLNNGREYIDELPYPYNFKKQNPDEEDILEDDEFGEFDGNYGEGAI